MRRRKKGNPKEGVDYIKSFKIKFLCRDTKTSKEFEDIIIDDLQNTTPEKAARAVVKEFNDSEAYREKHIKGYKRVPHRKFVKVNEFFEIMLCIKCGNEMFDKCDGSCK